MTLISSSVPITRVATSTRASQTWHTVTEISFVGDSLDMLTVGVSSS